MPSYKKYLKDIKRANPSVWQVIIQYKLNNRFDENCYMKVSKFNFDSIRKCNCACGFSYIKSVTDTYALDINMKQKVKS